jgi:hypothetical protein
MDRNVVYTDSRTSFPKERAALISSLRVNGKGDTVLVSDLEALAINKKDLRAIRAALKAKGATILEGRTKRRSTNAEQLADMIQDALDRWSHKGRRWSNEKVQAEDASKGGKALAETRAGRKVPDRRALQIWLDGRLTADEAVDRINGIPGYELNWTRSTAYRDLGRRKLKTGPISGRK